MSRWLQQTKTTSTTGRWQAIQEKKPQNRWQAQTALKEPISKFMTGAWYEKVFDPLMAGQYAIAGLGRKALKMDDAGAIEGIKQRATWVDIVKEKFPYQPTTDWKYNFIRELGRTLVGTGLDIALDPLWVLPPAKIAKMFKLEKAVKAIAETKPVAKIIEKVGPKIITRFGQPTQYVKLAKDTNIKILNRELRALEIGQPIAGLSKAEQLRVAQLIKGGISVGDIEKPLRAVADPAIEEFKRLGKRAVQEGLLNEDAFYEHFGRYMPRLYKTKEMPTGAVRFFGDKKPIRANLDRFKARKDIPEDIRAALGEIKEAGYPTTKGLAQLGQAVERAKFFRKVNKIYAKPKAYKDWLQLPKTKALGDLSGKWVSKPIYEDIQQFIRVASKGERVYRTALGTWKYGKVIANPATHLRNIYANFILADLGGLSPLRVDIYGLALKELKTKGKYYKELKKVSDILHETFYAREISDLLKSFETSQGTTAFQKMANGIQKLMKKGGNIYQAEEQWSKMALYIYKRKKGLLPEQAAKEAEKWLFNYREVPPLIETLRGSRVGGALGFLSGAYPFITFSYKAIPRIFEVAMTKTPRLTKWMKMYHGIDLMMEPPPAKEMLPDYMGKGMFLKLPFKDKYDRFQYLDLNFILPWGDIGEVGNTLRPNHPLWTTIYSLILNKHPLGWDIVKPGSTKQEAREAITDYLYKQLTPSPSPAIPGITKGGYSYQKIISALRKEEDYSGKVRSVKSAIMAALTGLKTTPIDIEIEKERREAEKLYDIREIQSRIRNLYILKKRNILTDDQKTKLEKAYQERIKKLGGKEYTPSNNWLEKKGFLKEKSRWQKAQGI